MTPTETEVNERTEEALRRIEDVATRMELLIQQIRSETEILREGPKKND